MAYYLIMTAPAVGHIQPVLPVARHLISRGHKLLWITGRKYQEQVKQSGAGFHPLHKEMDPGDLEFYDFYPKLKKLKGTDQMKYYLKHVFMDNTGREMEVISQVLKDFPADVLIGDTVTDGVYFKAEQIGMPSLMLSIFPLAYPSKDAPPFGLGLLPGQSRLSRIRNQMLNWFINHLLFRDVNQYANQVRQGLGLRSFREPYFKASLVLPSCICQLAPSSFEYPRRDLPDKFHFVGPVFPEADPDFFPPHWWPELGGARKVVLINQGTIATDVNELIKPSIEALRDENLLLIAVPVSPEQLENVPPNVRTEKYIPFANLLPHVDLMITNGGYGGTQFALAHGIPLVVAGGREDKMEVAARVEWSGAGVNLGQNSPSPDRIKMVVREVLNNPVYRRNALRMQEDIAKYDALRKIEELLTQLTGNGSINQ